MKGHHPPTTKLLLMTTVSFPRASRVFQQLLEPFLWPLGLGIQEWHQKLINWQSKKVLLVKFGSHSNVSRIEKCPMIFLSRDLHWQKYGSTYSVSRTFWHTLYVSLYSMCTLFSALQENTQPNTWFISGFSPFYLWPHSSSFTIYTKPYFFSPCFLSTVF